MDISRRPQILESIKYNSSCANGVAPTPTANRRVQKWLVIRTRNSAASEVQRSKRLQVENHGGAGPVATQKVVWIQVQPPHSEQVIRKNKKNVAQVVELRSNNAKALVQAQSFIKYIRIKISKSAAHAQSTIGLSLCNMGAKEDRKSKLEVNKVHNT